MDGPSTETPSPSPNHGGTAPQTPPETSPLLLPPPPPKETSSRTIGPRDILLAISIPVGLTLMGTLMALAFGAIVNEAYKDRIADLEATVTVLAGANPTVMVTQLVTAEVTREVFIEVEVPVTVTPQPPALPQTGDLRIAEIMHVPVAQSGEEVQEPWNEYIELLNCTTSPISIVDLWIGDGDGHGLQPDKLVPWADRFPLVTLGDGVLTSASEIPPSSRALVLAPGYIRGGSVYAPALQADTVVLTIDGTDPIRDFIGDAAGIEGARKPALDVLILYFGTANKISRIIDTYGMPDVSTGDDPFRIQPLAPDYIPLGLVDEGHSFGGVRRKRPCASDTADNWDVFPWSEMTPGY